MLHLFPPFLDNEELLNAVLDSNVHDGNSASKNKICTWKKERLRSDTTSHRSHIRKPEMHNKLLSDVRAQKNALHLSLPQLSPARGAVSSRTL